MYKNVFLILSFLLIIFTPCDSDSDFSSDAFIKDDAGNIFSKDSIPKKIISLAPNITETVFELKADNLLVGVTDYCDYPPDAKKKEKVGSLLDPNIERITSLNPDLIFMTTEGNSKYTYLSLKSNGFKVYVANPNDVNGICRMIQNIGLILGKKDIGRQISEKIVDTKKYYSIQNDSSKLLSCFMIVSLNPLITVNKFTYISELLNLSGFKNIYADEFIEYPNVNYEDVLVKNPDCIFFLCDTTKNTFVLETYLEIKNRLNVVNACKNNRIYGVDENIISRPGPRVMDGVKTLHSKVF
ncbi:MAG: helical backbone metal receptor [Ignavibacteriae bacterium]|nr:helical backbone metal receptor [Ignavibacteriota bacterium]